MAIQLLPHEMDLLYFVIGSLNGEKSIGAWIGAINNQGRAHVNLILLFHFWESFLGSNPKYGEVIHTKSVQVL